MTKSGAGRVTSSCAPERGKTLLTIGQDLFSIDEYVQGQYNASLHEGSIKRRNSFHPAATMFYTDIQTLRGLEDPVDYGSGIEYVGGLAETFPHSGIQIGLWLNGTAGCEDIVSGALQANIKSLFATLNSLDVPKIFLRVGYEFDNPSFDYSDDPSIYQMAFRKMVKDCEKELGHGACHKKVAFCWHSWAAPKVHPLEDFYPGDDVVDWVGLSIFQQLYPWAVDSEDAGAFAGGTRAQILEVLEFAKTHQKPTMIAESTPFGGIHGEDFGRLFGNRTTDVATNGWDLWFAPTLKLIEEYDIQMWSYINCDWDVQPMWANIGFGDTRLSSSKAVMKSWKKAVLENPRFVTSLQCDHSSHRTQQGWRNHFSFLADTQTSLTRFPENVHPFNGIDYSHSSSASKLAILMLASAITFLIQHRRIRAYARQRPRPRVSELQLEENRAGRNRTRETRAGYGSIN